MNQSERASVEFEILWKSNYARHRDRYFFPRINFWRDILPGHTARLLPSMQEGEARVEEFGAGVLVPPYNDQLVVTVRHAQINQQFRDNGPTVLRPGRFYPRGMIAAPETFPEETRPCRYLGNKGALLQVDLNHPLAAYPITLGAKVVKSLDPVTERGGVCHDIAYTMTDDGPGVQACVHHLDTDFFHGAPFGRDDDGDDAAFYSTPRVVEQIDAAASRAIAEIYGRILRPGMQVLDLMSGSHSHLPEQVEGLNVTGLGLNRAEMAQNGRLSKVVIHDLNSDKPLPFNDGAFEAALCCVSVQYLTEPIRIFQEISRVLKRGGPFIVAFSHRWFPPKVIRLWTELHPFERMGLVVEYFRKSGSFKDLHTESVRGYPRPDADRYFPQVTLSDPVFAVWGKTLL